ncbi:MAG: hypothetical protein V3T14_01995 [Myxococcota bacterium]
MGEAGSSVERNLVKNDRKGRWGRLGVLLGAAFSLTGFGGPIEAPPGVVDLRANPAAFGAQFDREVGVPRLAVLLSPA